MLHVATMLPNHENDPQRLERKRHIGNDVCVVVFLDDADAVFPIEQIKSHFNHVWVVVRPHLSGDAYQVSVVLKDGVPAVPPRVPEDSVVPKSHIREWMMAKLISQERSALRSAPQFAGKLLAARKMGLDMLITQFSPTTLTPRAK